MVFKILRFAQDDIHTPFQEDGTGASMVISSFFTGCTNVMRRAWSDIPPSGFDLGDPYFKSPLIGQPRFDSWQRI